MPLVGAPLVGALPKATGKAPTRGACTVADLGCQNALGTTGLQRWRIRWVLQCYRVDSCAPACSFSRYERGERGMNVSLLLTIADLFRIPGSRLLPVQHRETPRHPSQRRYSRRVRLAHSLLKHPTYLNLKPMR